MCYITLLSTTSTTDLAPSNTGLVQWSRKLPGIPEERFLAFPHQWLIGSKSGCSCDFRHLYISSVDLGFGEPEEWFPEEADDIEATLQVIATVRALVEKDESVDIVDAWPNAEERPLDGTIEVNLGEVSNRAFRFFENHRFIFINQNGEGSLT
ncbi:MAG: hypothetical protein V4710_13335 [Verrucomicrobiota bacterium]